MEPEDVSQTRVQLPESVQEPVPDITLMEILSTTTQSKAKVSTKVIDRRVAGELFEK